MDRRSRGATVGERIARERDRQGISLSAFSRRVTAGVEEGVRGTSRTALRNLEEGRVDSPGKEVVEAVAKVLGVEERWLWTGEPPRFAPVAAAGARPEPVVERPASTHGPRRDWMEAPPSRLRESARTAHLDRAEAPVPDVPSVPEAHPVWGPGVARTIASRSLLARGPAAVRARFWSVLRIAADHPGSGVSGPDDILRLARQLDELVLRPLELLRPGDAPGAPGGPPFEGYALSLLDSVETLLEGSEGTDHAPAPGRAEGPFRRPTPPPSLQQPGAMERREREGLTWRLM